jgi:hypothetical protein
MAAISKRPMSKMEALNRDRSLVSGRSFKNIDDFGSTVLGKHYDKTPDINRKLNGNGLINSFNNSIEKPSAFSP